MIKKVFVYLVVCLCCFCTSCQSSEDIVKGAVNKVNASCPLTISKIATITKAELVNNDVIFYTTFDESEDSFQSLTYQELKRLESDPKFKKGVIQDVFRQPIVNDAFKGISLEVIEKLDLNFKVIVKGNTSDLVIVCKMSWRDIIH